MVSDFVADMGAQQMSVWLGLLVGLAFGVLAEQTRFCFRRSLIGDDRRQASGVWLMALASAVAGTQIGVNAGLVSLDGNRLLGAQMPVAAIVAGGLIFGVGMVLARGCISRLTVLSATGNLRAAVTIATVALVAHATMKGVLSPLRTALSGLTVDVGPLASLSALPGGAALWTALIAGGAVLWSLRSGARPGQLTLAAILGALVPLAWIGGSILAADAFEPVPAQGLSFTGPWSDALFWLIASTAIPLGFGAALVGGTLAGAALSAGAGGRLGWQGFSTPAELRRYVAGGAMMGLGGVLAGGCTIGAGLSGTALLSSAALVALASMAAGALLTHVALRALPAAAASRA